MRPHTHIIKSLEQIVHVYMQRSRIMEAGFERSFLDWSCEDVCHWLSTLKLSKDYASQFKGKLSVDIA